jgi:hypothetical protein
MKELHRYLREDTGARAAWLIHALGIVGFLLIRFCLPLSFDLGTPKNLILSQATQYGVDIPARVSTAYRLIVGGSVAVLGLYMLFRRMSRKRWLQLHHFRELLLLAVAMICLSFLRIMDVHCDTLLLLLFCIWCWRMAVIVLTRFRAPLKILRQPDVFALSLGYGFLLNFSVVFLFGGQAGIAGDPVLLFIVALTLVAAAYPLLQRLFGWGIRRTSLFLAPLAAAPPLAFLVIELLFYARETHGHFSRFRLAWSLAMLALFALNAWRLHRKKTPSLRNIVRLAVGPAIVCGLVLLATYSPVIEQQTEMFETANQALPLMDVFLYGKIPLLDFMSSHMLSEQWFGYLYTLIFGYQDHSAFQVYGFMNYLVFLMLLYWLLNRIFSRPLLSAFFILLFPLMREVLFEQIFSAILLFFFTRKLVERPSPRAFFSFCLALLAIILWRLDAGSAAVFATAVYLPLLWWACRVRFPFVAAVKGIGLFLGLLLALTGIAMALRSPDMVLKDVRMALHYFSGNQAHGLRQLLTSFAQQFFILHVLLPVSAVICCACILMELRAKSRDPFGRDHQLLAASLLLFLLFFANFQRGLVRHGYAEGEETYLTGTFFAAAALLLAYRFAASRAVLRIPLFYGGAFALFFIIKFFPYKPGMVTAESALAESSMQKLDRMLYSRPYEGRVLPDSGFIDTYRPLKEFMDRHLSPQQSFLDFSNSPMLYYHCRRESPGYFCQNLQNTVDDYLQLALLGAVDTHKTPVVVFAGYPRTWMDRVDDVPNAVRLPLIAEYIYSSYRPYGILGTRSIWVSRSMQVPPLTVQDTLPDRPEIIPLGLLPEYTGAFYATKAQAGDLREIRSWQPDGTTLHDDVLQIALDSAVLSEQHCFIAITFRKDSAGKAPYQVEAQFFDSAAHRPMMLQFDRKGAVSDMYLLRLSNHYFWHRNSFLRLHITHGKDIARVSLLNDPRT